MGCDGRLRLLRTGGASSLGPRCNTPAAIHARVHVTITRIHHSRQNTNIPQTINTARICCCVPCCGEAAASFSFIDDKIYYIKDFFHFHAHMFNGLFSRTTWASRYQRGKTSLDLNKAKDDGVLGWQWHQLDHMQTICTSLQTDNHINTSLLNFYRPDALPDAQPTVSKHWRHWHWRHFRAQCLKAKYCFHGSWLPSKCI